MPKLDCADVALDYEVDGAGPALVFVHGAFADRRVWRPQRAHFACRRRVVTYDLRGHGATGPSRRRRYDAALFARDLEGLLDGLGIHRAVLCGASFGGIVAQVFAAHAPERVSGLVLAGSFADTMRLPGLPRPWPVAPELLGLAIRLCGRRRFADYVWRRTAGTGHGGERRSAEGTALARIEPEELAKIYRAIFGFRAQPGRFEAPTLVICGAREPEMLRAQSRRLAALYRARLVEIENAGHVASLEAPEAFNAALAGFLAAKETADCA